MGKNKNTIDPMIPMIVSSRIEFLTASYIAIIKSFSTHWFHYAKGWESYDCDFVFPPFTDIDAHMRGCVCVCWVLLDAVVRCSWAEDRE